MNFWKELKRPILCLAPMADVTDVAFRFIISKYSKDKVAPRSFSEVGYVTYTEFVSADGLVRAPEEGRRKLLKDLEYSEIERPIVAQFFTSKPEMMEKVAALAVELGFDGVDINMGCPDQSIEKQGAGAALIKNPLLARELIKAAKRGASRGALAKWGNTDKMIPVSVKTRLGYNKDELEEPARINESLGGWLPELLAENPAAIVIHARTRKEMSKVPARWERVKRAVEIRDEIQGTTSSPTLPLAKGKGEEIEINDSLLSFPSPLQGEGPSEARGGEVERTLIIGNGDVESVEDAILKCKETGADGAMLGRAIFGNPWLFANRLPSREEKLAVLVEHSKLFEEKLGGIKSFAIMKKHFKSYLLGLDGAKELKEKLMETNNAIEVERVVKDFLLYNK